MSPSDPSALLIGLIELFVLTLCSGRMFRPSHELGDLVGQTAARCWSPVQL